MRKLERNDIFNYAFLAKPAFSPTGKRAAFVVSRAVEARNGYESDIWLSEDGRVMKLTSGGDGSSYFFEDDTHILFAADRDPSYAKRREDGEKLTSYFRISVDGGEAERAFTVPLAVSEIKKLPCGSYAVTAVYNAGDPDFSNLDETGKQLLAKRVKSEADYQVMEEIPVWENGGSFTNRMRTRLYIFDPKTGKASVVTDELTNVWNLCIDGDRIYFLARRFDVKMQLTSSVFVYDVQSGALSCLLPDAGWCADMLFVHEGSVAFFGQPWRGIYELKSNPALYTLAGNGEVRMLFDGDEEPGGCPGSDCCFGGGESVMLRGGRIIYAASYHTGTRVRSIGFDGSSAVLAQTDNAINSFDVNGENVISVCMSDSEPQELYSGFMGSKLTHFNAWLGECSTVKPARCDCNGDGCTVEGFVMEPADYTPGKKYPAVFEIHGGPKGTYGGGYFHEMQVFANAGFFVYYCNPRGGDGRGEAFADIRGKYGTVDYDDLMRFSDHVLETHPDIDPARVAVTGGSYGGYMTNWIIGHTSRFAAACAQRSISNWISKFGTTDIGYFFNANQNLSTPWDNVEKLWWHSPVKYADKATTPTLFIHSEQDYRCWMAEGLQMFTALRYHGVDARLCLFHGENHELSRSGKPLHRIRRLKEMQDWFERYLVK